MSAPPAKWDSEIELPPARGSLGQITDPVTGSRHFEIKSRDGEWIFAHESDCVPESEWA